MRILLVSAELTPLAAVGGIGEYILGLGSALLRQGHDVRVVLPSYGFLRARDGLTLLSERLVVPLGVPGVVLGTGLRGFSNEVYFKIGLITIIGLSAKNAVLIIEFAKDLQAQGRSAIEAVLEAAHLRFRPIVMTSMAFVLGVLPLAISSGAGSASQRSIGTGVMSGMVSAVVLSVMFVPVFFVVVRRWFKGSERQRKLYAHELDPGKAQTPPAAGEGRP